MQDVPGVHKISTDTGAQPRDAGIMDELMYVVKFLLGFSPWLLFLFLPTDGWDPLRRVVVICLAASVVFGWGDLRRGFILQWCSLAFFLFCTISFWGFKWVWLAEHMGIIGNGFLDGVIWITVLIGKPFTLQYAQADLPKEQWHDEGLIHSCRFLAIFWGALLLVPTAFYIFRFYHPTALPALFYFYLSVICIVIGVSYTTIYKQMKRKQRQDAVNSPASPN
ncbi:MAG: hypothetical protein M1269_08405 [Chloroflexi bacterium]|nr:hypothetical protein [Chloroflexota bacterium]